jgi:hypothetical protein
MTHSREDLVARAADFDRAVLERDHELAEAVLTEDFALVLVHPTPATMPRERWLEVLPDYVVDSWEAEEQTIEVRDGVGTILQRVRMDATVLGQDRSGLFVISDTWVIVDEEWRIWRRHSSPLSAGRMPGATD